jgi:hypothetical protein
LNQQIDIAVDLGVIPALLAEIEFLREFVASVPNPPSQLIDGILHQGDKMILGGTSKSNKSWCLLDLRRQHMLALWNLRGRNADLSLLRPKLEEHLGRHQFGTETKMPMVTLRA